MPVIFGDYELITPEGKTTPWAMANSGFVAVGKKDGCRYQIKLYGSAKYPNRAVMKEEQYQQELEKCHKLLEKRRKISAALREANGPDQLLACAEEVFLTTEGAKAGVCEAVPFIEGAVKYQDYRKDPAWIHDAFLSAATAVSRLHAVSVLHTDIKPGNMVFTVNGAGEACATLIDFDQACFTDAVPVGVGGTINYQAPELIILTKAGDKKKKAEIVSWIGPHTDVFALGASFAEIITGAPPKVQYQKEWVVTWDQTAVQPAYLRELLKAMLNPEPEERPTAAAVAETLRKQEFTCSDCRVSLWPEHEATLRLNPDRAREVTAVTPEIFNGEKGYVVCFADRRVRRYSLSMMRGTALLIARKAGDSPAPVRPKPVRAADDSGLLPADAARYELDPAVMMGRGYVRLMHDGNGYVLVKEDGDLVPFSLKTMEFFHIIKAKGGTKR